MTENQTTNLSKLEEETICKKCKGMGFYLDTDEEGSIEQHKCYRCNEIGKVLKAEIQNVYVYKRQKATMTPENNGAYKDGLKYVKNAYMFQERGIFFIRHYNTIIFSYNPKSKLCEVNWHCSMTSDRQIRYALKFFEVHDSNIIDVSDGSKWSYGGFR